MKPAVSASASRSVGRAAPASTARRAPASREVPTVHAGHCPQASRPKNAASDAPTDSGQAEAPTTSTAAVPRAEPASLSASGWSGVSSWARVRGGAEGPAGNTMPMPSGVPPPCSSTTRRSDVPSATSYTPGRRRRRERALQVDDRLARPDGPGGDDEPADHVAGPVEHHPAVLDGARLALGSVADDEGLAALDPNRLPLPGGRKPAAAPTPKA